jgi:hypothetical protein
LPFFFISTIDKLHSHIFWLKTQVRRTAGLSGFDLPGGSSLAPLAWNGAHGQ